MTKYNSKLRCHCPPILLKGYHNRSSARVVLQVDSMPEELKNARVTREGFMTFAHLWRNVHSLAVATDLHYNSMGYFRKADFKVRLASRMPRLPMLSRGLISYMGAYIAQLQLAAAFLSVLQMSHSLTSTGAV